MNDEVVGRYGIDPYLEWVKKEGIPIHEDYGIDLFAVDLAIWPRYGVKGAAAHLKGRGDFANMFLIELPPGGSTTPQRHLYEDVYYVLEGNGNTQIELPDGAKRSFEWNEKSLFAIPLNMRHRHFNARNKRTLLVTTTNLPLVMNTFFNERFIFETEINFPERLGKANHFGGEGDLVTAPGQYVWETNFVPDLAALETRAYGDRGGGGTSIKFVLAEGLMHAHISEMPPGVYKKAHRHGPGTHVMCVSGVGFSLLWFDSDQDFLRIDWKHGVVFPPADQQFHQHFNTCNEPARYLATCVGGLRYPLTEVNRHAWLGGAGQKAAAAISVKQGGDQIEYEDQDPRIHAMWLEAMKKNGATSKMDKYFTPRQPSR